ncbi:MAG: DUF2244 domain-containing protein [Proteobacteria bacterium]|nr:DUF2244 domain-containing protein [Pseudomonadota bacterium]
MVGETDNTGSPGSGGGRVFFDAVLRPHRSLSPLGFRLLMAASVAGLLVVGLLFWLLGAWPVIGFCGLEFGLLYGAFRLNYRAARAYERLRLSDEGLEISRVRPNGVVARVWRMQPNWLRIDIDNPPEHDSQLTLSSHGRRMVVGSFLAPDERLDLAKALAEALDRRRTAPHPCAAS